MKKHLEEVEYLRVITMLGVVYIHFLSIPQAAFADGSRGKAFFYFWQSLLVYSVPCFIFLSMMMTGYGFSDKKINISRFYKKRLFRLAVPYIIWSMLYVIFNFLVGKYGMSDILSIEKWAYWLFYGKAHDHLYFLPIMLQFTLFTPMMQKLVQKTKSSLLMCFIIAFVPQIIIYFLNRYYIYQHYKMLTSSMLWYWCIGFTGLFFGFFYDKCVKILEKYVHVVLLFNLFTFCVHMYYSNLMLLKIPFDTKLYTLNLYAYLILCISTSVIVSRKLSKVKSPYISYLQSASYGTYLMHPIFTGLIRKYVKLTGFIPNLMSAVITVPVIIFLCSYITTYLSNKNIVCYAFANKKTAN